MRSRRRTSTITRARSRRPRRRNRPQAPQRAQHGARLPTTIRSKPPAAIARCQPQAAPQYAPRPAQRAADANFGAAPSYDQWPAPAAPSHDPYGHDLGGYLPGDAPFPANSNQPHMDPLQQADWAMPAASYGDPSLDQQSYGRGQVGYDQQHGGALEPTYNQDEAGAYEAEEPRRGSWTMRIAGAVVVAIGLGYGLAQAYKVGARRAGPTARRRSSPATPRPPRRSRSIRAASSSRTPTARSSAVSATAAPPAPKSSPVAFRNPTRATARAR